jgi:hypothetical protein
MQFWDQAMDLILTTSQAQFGKTVAYQRPNFDAFNIVGIPQFNDRLEDPQTAPFESIWFRVKDFNTANFTSSVEAVFRGVPNQNGTITFDGVTYTIVNTLNPATPNQFFRGASAFACAESLSAAINALPGYAGSAYSAATVAHPTCQSTYIGNGDGSATVTVTYRTAGVIGQNIPAGESMTSVDLLSTVFAGGLPQEGDLITLEGILFRVSDVPEPDNEGGIHVRLEKKSL